MNARDRANAAWDATQDLRALVAPGRAAEAFGFVEAVIAYRLHAMAEELRGLGMHDAGDFVDPEVQS